MYLIQVFLPVYTNTGEPFNSQIYSAVKEELTQVFSGITMYNRAPASGIWKDNNKIIYDEIIIFEVLAPYINSAYWHSYKLTLQQLFEQDTILIRASPIELL